MENRKKIEERNRKGYYVEIKKDTLYFYTIATLSLGIVFYAFLVMNDQSMRIKRDIEKTKSLKYKMNRGRDGLSRTVERESEHLGNRPAF